MSEKLGNDMKARIQESMKYQKMAIEALIPVEQKKHIDVIEKEVKTLFVNGMLDLLVETGTMERVMKYAADYFTESCREQEDAADEKNDKEKSRKESSVRKVMVGE